MFLKRFKFALHFSFLVALWKFSESKKDHIEDSNFNASRFRHKHFGAAKFSQTLFDLSENSTTYAKGLNKAYAQENEDIWLYENFFYGMVNGVIIESGALDGHKYSTSSLFEEFANWTAIHIEPDPNSFRGLIQYRPNAINIHSALCTEPKSYHFVTNGAAAVHGILEFMTDEFLYYHHRKIFKNEDRIAQLPIIPCIPLKYYVRQLHIRHVDLWVLDVEGAEEVALQGTDFTSVHFSVIMMECEEWVDKGRNKRKMDILEKHGYECRLILRNCVCKNKRFKPSSRAIKTELKLYNGSTYINEGW